MSGELTNVRLTTGPRMGTHRVEIQAPSGEWVDISECVQGVTAQHEAGDVSRMEMRLAAFHGYEEGMMMLLLPCETVRMLRAFGWAMPEGTATNPDGSYTMRMDKGSWAVGWGMQ